MEMFAMREFQFSSAASLDVDEKAMQGHNYELRVVVKGTPDEKGVILDTRIIEKIVNLEIITKLDKKNLNDIIPNPQWNESPYGSGISSNHQSRSYMRFECGKIGRKGPA